VDIAWVMALVAWFCVGVTRGRDIYLKEDGNDKSDCLDPRSACRTVRTLDWPVGLLFSLSPR